MKLLLLPILMTFVAVAQVFCEEIDPKEEVDYWTSSNQIQVVMRTAGCFYILNFVIHRCHLLLCSSLKQKRSELTIFIVFWMKDR